MLITIVQKQSAREISRTKKNGLMGQVILHNEDVHNLCMLPHIVRVCEI